MTKHEWLAAVIEGSGMCYNGKDCDKYQTCTECCNHTISEFEDSIRAEAQEKTIDEIIKTLSKSEDTILSDKQFYALIELKEQMKGDNNDGTGKTAERMPISDSQK